MSHTAAVIKIPVFKNVEIPGVFHPVIKGNAGLG
jgi:hypothetical protein